MLKSLFFSLFSVQLLCQNVSFVAFSNAVLSYNHSSNEGDANGIDFLHLMEERGVRANCQTYLWLLDGCLSSGSLTDGWKLHAKILKLGFCAEVVLCEHLMDLYIALGDLDGTIKTFDEMPVRSLSCWNKVLHSFVAGKMTDRVLCLFRLMVRENVKPDERSYAGVLRACGGGDVPFYYVEQIHAMTISHGYENSLLVSNPLMDLYFKNGFLNSAKKVFESLQKRDSVSWVAMISGLSQSCEEEVILQFCQMHKLGVYPTPYVFSSVLSACNKIKLI